MGQKLSLNGMSANFTNGAVSLANATATVTVGTAITHAVVNGKFITSALAASAVALSFVQPKDGTTAIANGSVPQLAANQAAVIVHCVNAAGARKELLGDVVNIDAAGKLQDALNFSGVPDTLTPIAYSVIKNTTNPFIWGTTNWNATGVTAVTTNVAVLPDRPLSA